MTSQPEPGRSPEKILEVAEPLFSSYGFAAVGMREVASRSGLSKSALFHHFPTKAALYQAVLDRVLLTFEQRLAEAEDPARAPLDQVRRWALGVIDAFVEHPSYARLVLRSVVEGEVAGPEMAEEHREIFGRILARVSRVVERGIAAREIRPVSIPLTIQSVVGMVIYHFADEGFADELVGSPYEPEGLARLRDHLDAFISHALMAPKAG